jgi:hypothetical protein
VNEWLRASEWVSGCDGGDGGFGYVCVCVCVEGGGGASPEHRYLEGQLVSESELFLLAHLLQLLVRHASQREGSSTGSSITRRLAKSKRELLLLRHLRVGLQHLGAATSTERRVRSYRGHVGFERSKDGKRTGENVTPRALLVHSNAQEVGSVQLCAVRALACWGCVNAK